MKNFKHKTLLVFAVVVGGVVLSVGNGCSKSFTTTSVTGDGTNNAAGTGGTTPTDGVPVIPGAKTVSLVYSKQVVDQLAACSGLATPSGATMQMYEAKKGAISTYGTANTVTAPMMMAVASIAGEICNDLINQEVSSGQQRLFVGYNMSSNAVPSSAVIQDSVTRLSLSCWNRMPSQNENDLIMGMIGSSVNAENSAARKTALMVCTSMLSSLDALLN